MVTRPTDSRDLSLAKLELTLYQVRPRALPDLIPPSPTAGCPVTMLSFTFLAVRTVRVFSPPSLSIAHFSTHFARDAEPTFDDGDGSTRAQRRPASRGGGQHVCVLTRSACASPDRSGHQPGSLCNTAEATPLVPNEHFAGPFGWSGASRGFSRGHAYVAVHAAISRALRQRRSG